jgi:hypothetical protein
MSHRSRCDFRVMGADPVLAATSLLRMRTIKATVRHDKGAVSHDGILARSLGRSETVKDNAYSPTGWNSRCAALHDLNRHADSTLGFAFRSPTGFLMRFLAFRSWHMQSVCVPSKCNITRRVRAEKREPPGPNKGLRRP